MKSYLSLPVFVLVIISMYSCKEKKPVGLPEEKKVILYAEFMHEVHSFSPVLTTRRDFIADHLFFGEEVKESGLKEKKQLAGFLKAVDKIGKGKIEAIPIVQAKSMSGGPVERGFYDEIKSLILEKTKAQGKVDGIYISMHGSMGVEGMFDPEGEILTEIRKLVGEDVFIAASFDLHANITKRRAEAADILLGYKTNPHRDHFETGYRSGDLLIRAVLGEIKPEMSFTKMRLLKGGGMNIDFLPPFRKIFREMRKMEKQKDVLSVSFFPVHLFIDEPEVGYSTLAITDRNPSLAKSLSERIAEMAWEVRDIPTPVPSTAAEGIEIARKKGFARKFGTVVFCDVSDAVGAGTPGENTWILKALLEEGSDMVSYLTMRDEEAAIEAWKYNIGEEVSLVVGGKLDTIYNKPIPYAGKIIYKEEASYGKTLIIKNNGIHLVLSELPMASWYTSDWKELGLSLWKADIVVVKNLFPFRYRYILYNRKTVNVVTPGMSNTDPFALEFRHIPRPIYPLDKIDSWRQ